MNKEEQIERQISELKVISSDTTIPIGFRIHLIDNTISIFKVFKDSSVVLDFLYEEKKRLTQE